MLLANFIPVLYANESTTTTVIDATKKGTTKIFSIILTLSIFFILSYICFPIFAFPSVNTWDRVSHWKTKAQ